MKWLNNKVRVAFLFVLKIILQRFYMDKILGKKVNLYRDINWFQWFWKKNFTRRYVKTLSASHCMGLKRTILEILTAVTGCCSIVLE